MTNIDEMNYDSDVDRVIQDQFYWQLDSQLEKKLLRGRNAKKMSKPFKPQYSLNKPSMHYVNPTTKLNSTAKKYKNRLKKKSNERVGTAGSSLCL